MAQYLQPPGALTGGADQKAEQLYRQLFVWSEQLNVALEQLDNKIATREAEPRAASAGTAAGTASDKVDKDLASSYQALRALIIKSATTVRTEMDEVVRNMNSSYVAQSTFGTFMENLDTTMTTSAQGLLIDLDYESQLDALDKSMAGFQTYKTETEQHIKIGVVRYNDDGTMEAGVVVGKNLNVVTVDGKEVVRSSDMYACFTADRLSFWKDGVEVAYFSNRALYVTDVRVLSTLDIGDDWRVTTTNGFAIKWMGGGAGG